MEKTVFRFYPAGTSGRNEADLDRRSRAGWALQKAGFCRFVFRQDPTARRYRLDYCPASLGPEACARRKSLWTDAGWEPAGALPTGWIYYGKPVDPSLPEAAYAPPVEHTAAQRRAAVAITRLFWLQAVLLTVGAVLAVLAVIRQQAMMPAALLFLALFLLVYFRIKALQERFQDPDEGPK